MTATVRNTGSATAKSVQTISLIWAIIMVPTTTSAAAATSLGTMVVSGVRNIASRNSTPVTRLASPVRAPSPIPAPDSMNTVLDDPEVRPPATAPTPSTMSADLMFGKLPFSSASPASLDRPVMVPMASKKLVKTSVKTSISAARAPMRSKLPKLNAPTRLRSGTVTHCSGSTGRVRLQPPGFSWALPSCANASTMTAMTVPTTMPMSSAPRTLRATSTPVSRRVKTNSRVGMVATEPSTPRPTGGEPNPVDVTKPAFTRPMNAMNRPMPTVMAILSWIGTASKIMRRRLVADSSTMMRPLITTRPIASGQVTWPTTLTARNELMPRPAANANGRREISPNRMVMTPEVRAVTAATWVNPRELPSTSALPLKMIGFKMTMYAIATKVTMPPRTSRPTVDPLLVMEKNESTRLIGAEGAFEAVLVTAQLYCQQILRHQSRRAAKSVLSQQVGRPVGFGQPQ